MSISEKDQSVLESQSQYIEYFRRLSEPRFSLRRNKGTTEKDNVKNVSYEDVLNTIGFGKTQYLMLFTCGLLLMMVICETMGMSIITIASKCDFNTNSVEMAVMSAAAFIGILVSSYLWGYLCDIYGRKPILMYTTLIGNAVSLASIFVPNFWLFVFLRFVVGIFIAGASSTTYAYLGEFVTLRHRPVVINFTSMFVALAMTYVPAIAWLVLSMEWSLDISDTFAFRPWRLLTVFNILPGFIAILIMIKLPDSPRILMTNRKQDEAFEATNWIAKFNTGKSLADFNIYEIYDENPTENDKLLQTSKSFVQIMKHLWIDTKPLFRKPHLLNFVTCCVVMCGVFFVNSGMGLWYPTIQNRLGSVEGDNMMTICQVIDASMEQQNTNSTENVCDDTITRKSYIDSITFGLVYLGAYFVLGSIINPLGRKRTIILLLIVSAICGVILHWIKEPIAIVASFIMFVMLPGLCVSILSGAVVDLVPTSLRGKAVCICLMLGRSGSVIGSNIIGILLESYCSMTFGVFYGLVLVCAGLTLILPI
ncbi:synaptic vesicle glycoprotein 2B isoform X1 [Musca autumnalis]|uniref:synaptic vesicle glycoprotein 2B isoform X1 n=1 Tax=Musca autumnalis TaxID=221902 RepID=UPI003CEFFF92